MITVAISISIDHPMIQDGTWQSLEMCIPSVRRGTAYAEMKKKPYRITKLAQGALTTAGGIMSDVRVLWQDSII